MDTNSILKAILQKFRDNGYTQVDSYKRFGYVKETNTSVVISRENGKEVYITLETIRIAIEAVKTERSVYLDGPSRLREFGITHITSPVWSLLHLVKLSDY